MADTPAHIAEEIRDRHRTGQDVTLVRVVQTRGFSSRERAGLAAFTAREPVAGSIFSGAVDGQLLAAIAKAPRIRALIDVTLTDADATAAGLSCGGSARLLVQPSTDISASGWAELAGGGPVCVITDVREGEVADTAVFGADAIGAAEQRYGPGVARLFRRGATQTALLETAAATSVVTSLWPVPVLVVVGSGSIAAALVACAGLLEWDARIVDEASAATDAIAGLTRADAVVVLSHDRLVDGPAMQAALRSSVGYVGGLGSAHTQAARASWLTEHGCEAAVLARIHGPAGLDIGAYSPAEIATSITAEILAVRSGAGGGSLQGRQGPIR